MRFSFIDRIVAVEAGRSVTAVKAVSYAEPFLSDHFPGAPVLPGAMMVEGAVEAATFFLRSLRGFPLEDYLVGQVRRCRFSRVVRPGDLLTITVSLEDDAGDADRRDSGGVFKFRARGVCDEERVFSARFEMNAVPADTSETCTPRNDACLAAQKELWSILNVRASSR